MNTDNRVPRVLFVCLGNICRSPTAEAVFNHQLNAAELKSCVQVDSAGTGGWHVGASPDPRAMEHAQLRGYEMAELKARKFVAKDFERFDYILAMDVENLEALKTMRPDGYSGKLGLMLDYLPPNYPDRQREVPDPYYGGDMGFEQVLDLIEASAGGLLREVRENLSRTKGPAS